MLLFFIVGYLGLSGLLVLGMMWASHKGDLQMHAISDDLLLEHRHDVTSKEELIADLPPA
jgi:hypothetical protein